MLCLTCKREHLDPWASTSPAPYHLFARLLDCSTTRFGILYELQKLSGGPRYLEYYLMVIHQSSDMADLAEKALAEAANASSASDGPSGQDNDNKFQKAISAWRSRYTAPKTDCLLTSTRYKSHNDDPIPRQHCFRDRTIPTRLYSSAKGSGTEDEGLQKIGRLCQAWGGEGTAERWVLLKYYAG